MSSDPAFLAFLRARLAEEAETAAAREQDPTRDTGVGLLHELLWTLEHDQEPDRMSLGLLTVAYAAHPDFREEWNRWRR